MGIPTNKAKSEIKTYPVVPEKIALPTHQISFFLFLLKTNFLLLYLFF